MKTQPLTIENGQCKRGLAFAGSNRRPVRSIHCCRKHEYPSDTQKRRSGRRPCFSLHPLPKREPHRTLQPRNNYDIGIPT